MTVVEDKYLSKIAALNSKSGRYAFRGQADSSWKLHSAATRRLVQHLGDDDIENSGAFGHLYIVYHRIALLDPARTYGFDIYDGHCDSDLQLLTKLQHFGAATGLIDFTWDSLVALWFATSSLGGKKCNGRVFVVDLNDTVQFQKISNEPEQQKLSHFFSQATGPTSRQFYWEPMLLDDSRNRILRQQSLFLIGRPSEPEVPTERVILNIEITESDKEKIRKELEYMFGISEQSLFPDVYGFSVANSATSPMRRLNDPDFFLYQGNHLYQRNEYDKAIIAYDECISLDPNQPKVYYLRGNAKAQIKDFLAAKNDYDIAIEKKLEKSVFEANTATNSLAKQLLSMAFFNRGNVHAAINEYESSIQDYDEAIKYSTLDGQGSIYYNRANIKAKINLFDSALNDYDLAIQDRVRPARFNKGNVLALTGRFEKALDCYIDEISEPGSQIDCNNNIAIMTSIIAEIGDFEPVIESEDSKKEDSEIFTPMIKIFIGEEKKQHEVVEPLDHGGDATTFICTGNTGNIGNFGGVGTSGGEGFKGDGPFFIKVVR